VRVAHAAVEDAAVVVLRMAARSGRELTDEQAMTIAEAELRGVPESWQALAAAVLETDAGRDALRAHSSPWEAAKAVLAAQLDAAVERGLWRGGVEPFGRSPHSERR
jgi:hypothetical protein